MEPVLIVNNMTINEEKQFQNSLKTLLNKNQNIKNFVNFWKFHYVKSLNGRQIILQSVCPQVNIYTYKFIFISCMVFFI